ncbi:MAG: 30S ribosomal protein S12 methylthiotransferase RimO [Planctomycetota bacterium]|nr:30S ribosomal protein S12 methylthiotransferase RimO [Planctomycetota bacterium]
MKEKTKQKRITVGFVALGCPKNMVDSERMLAQIAQAGMVITAQPLTADVIVINTCGFIAPAKAEAIESIKKAVASKHKGNVKKVIVAGCLSQRMGKELFNETKGIDAVVGLGQRDNIVQIIRKTFQSDKPQAYLARSHAAINDDKIRLRITPDHWAYLRISEGCNHRCSFCTIPAIRGRFISKSQKNILAEARELISAGAVELNIIAQDVTSYGRDLKIKNGLATLLKKLEKIDELKWIRLLYLYPTGITQKLIETIADSKKILPYFDIPIQHINNQILKAMRRPDSKEQICELIEKLRLAIPGIVLRTTLIVGFPGETDKQFEELLDFINWARFDCLGCFKYYAEEGTPAAKMPNQIPDSVKKRRLKTLMLAQQKIAFAKNKERVGALLTCLVESVDKKRTGRGRFYGQAPDIDSICIIKNCTAKPGDLLNTKVVGTKDYDLLVRQV